MRAERSALWVFLSLFIATAAAAQSSSLTVSPTSIFVGDIETFVTLRGDHLLGNVDTQITFTAPDSSTFTLGPSAGNSESIEVAVPFEVASTAGHYTITVVAIDDTGNTTSGPAGFDVVARPTDVPPTLGLPENIMVEAVRNGELVGAVVDFSVSAINGDGTPNDVTCNYASGAFFPYGETSVLCSSTNAFGTATGSFIVDVRDTTAPVLTLPADIFSTTPTVTWDASALDNIDGGVSVSCSPASGSSFPDGYTVVQCSAADSHGNVSEGSFFVFVGSTPPPPLVLPGNMVVEATGPGGAVVNFTATSDANSTVTCVPASGSTFAFIGSTVSVQCTATNTANISTTGSFFVTVVDTTAPALIVPSDITTQATSNAGAAVSFTATASDIVDGPVTPSCFPPSGSTFPVGTTQVLCSASDIRGNTSFGAFNVTVVLDNTPPVVTATTASPSSLWPPNHVMVPVTVSVTATDNLDPSPVSTIVSVSSDQPIDGTGDGDLAPDWVVTGPLTANLRSERSHGNDRTYTITVSTCDFTGNCTTSTAQVKVTQSSAKKRSSGH